MRWAALPAVLALTAAAAPPPVPSPAPPAPQPAARYDTAPILAELDKECADGTFSGVVVVRAHGRTLIDHSCGMADQINALPNTHATRFKIYSTSKFMTALTVMRLVEQHRMALDAPIKTYIPDAPATWDAVTVRMLLNHISGIPDLTGGLVEHFTQDHPHAMRALLSALSDKDRALATPAGQTFHYNNFGFELLADAAAHATGTPFATLVADIVFKPAGMATASIEAPNILMGHPLAVNEPGLAYGYNGAPGKLEQATNYAFIQLGAGAVRASVDDFVALDAALSAGKIISAASQAEMTRALLPDERPDSGRRFGLGIIVGEKDGVAMEGHTGGTNGYISDFERYRGDDAMMIALTNRGFVKTRWLRDAVATMLKGAR